ncbi:LysR family transcriptional regulator [Shewanella sp. Scap07]|uniref:LysR family transcriptional regulator n=1 Tax=Shewanella sp. Scap07 TaxID=2589987 RepID=UPI0015BA8005|nr:LysR family transcriptional regulator [Shewanella sp. Scap07]QLE83717.1 LysR family transcriptional regulator [Shewanella sp. Scap07]
MNFSLEQLAAFVSVYEEKSFSKAAIKINKHRTTVGQVIANLEDQVAVTLFERNPRTVEPTQDGHLLYHYAKQAIEQARTFDKVALSLSFGELDSITIAYSSFIPHLALSHIREQLITDFPSMRVNMLVRTQQEIRQGLADETIHFGIVNVHKASAMSNIDYTLLGQMPFVPYASKDSELAKLPSSQIYTALKSSREFVLKSLVDEGMSDRVLLSPNYDVVDQLALAIKLTQKGLGWTLLPKNRDINSYIATHLVELKCQQIRDGFTIPVALWSQQSKPIIEVRESIKQGIDNYLSPE